MPRVEKDPCCATSRGCNASAGTLHRKLRTECFSCGLAVCTAPGCSIRTIYYSYGTQRVCVGCLEMRSNDSSFLQDVLEKLYAAEAEADGHDKSVIPLLVDGYLKLLPSGPIC